MKGWTGVESPPLLRDNKGYLVDQFLNFYIRYEKLGIKITDLLIALKTNWVHDIRYESVFKGLEYFRAYGLPDSQQTRIYQDNYFILSIAYWRIIKNILCTHQSTRFVRAL